MPYLEYRNKNIEIKMSFDMSHNKRVMKLINKIRAQQIKDKKQMIKLKVE